MPPITAVLFTHNDALRIGRALETLWFPSETIVVDHGSVDRTVAIARQYGARIVAADEPHAVPTVPASHNWIFCLTARESVGDELEASLFEWSLLPAAVTGGMCGSVRVQEERGNGWTTREVPETRLVPRDWRLGPDGLPVPCSQAQLLCGNLLRFAQP